MRPWMTLSKEMRTVIWKASPYLGMLVKLGMKRTGSTSVPIVSAHAVWIMALKAETQSLGSAVVVTRFLAVIPR